MNKLLLAVLLTSNFAIAGDWDDLSRMHNDNMRARAYANPPIYVAPPIYIAPPVYGASPVYIAPIQGNPNLGNGNWGEHFKSNIVVPSPRITNLYED